MKSITYKGSSLKGRVLCALFGHKFFITRFLGEVKEFECSVCSLQVTSDDATDEVSLKQKHHEVNEELINRHQQNHSHIAGFPFFANLK